MYYFDIKYLSCFLCCDFLIFIKIIQYLERVDYGDRDSDGIIKLAPALPPSSCHPQEKVLGWRKRPSSLKAKDPYPKSTSDPVFFPYLLFGPKP